MADTTKYKKGGGESCVVVGCSNSRRHLHQWKTEECLLHGISHDSCPCLLPFSLHRMPDKEDVRLAWCAAINRPTDSLPKRVIVCSDHFIDGRPTAQNNVPSLKLDYEKEVKQGRRIFKRRISENITDTPRILKKKKYVFLGACPKYWYNKKGNRTCGDNSSKDLRSVERAETWGDNHQDTALLSSNSFDIKQEPMTDDQEGVNFEHSYVDERTENQSDNYQDTTLLPSNSFDIKQEPMTADQEGVNFEHSYVDERTENQSDNYQDTTLLPSNSFDIKQEPMTAEEGVNFEHSYVDERTENQSDNYQDTTLLPSNSFDIKQEPMTAEEGVNFEHSYVDERTENQSDNYQDTTLLPSNSFDIKQEPMTDDQEGVNFEHSYVNEKTENQSDNYQDTTLLPSNSFDIKQEPMTAEEGVNFEHSYVDERTENQSDNYQDTTLLPSNSFDIKQEPMTDDQEGVNFEHSYVNEKTENQSDNYQDTTLLPSNSFDIKQEPMTDDQEGVNFEHSYVDERTENQSDNYQDTTLLPSNSFDIKQEPMTAEEGVNFEHSYVDERTENQSDNYQDTTLLPSNSFDIKQEPMTDDQEGVNFEHSYVNEKTENQSDNYQDTTFVNFENSYVTENTETRSDNRHDTPSLIMTCDDCDLKDEPNTDEEGANKSFDHSYAKSSPAHDSSAPDYDFSVMGKQSTEIFGGDCNTDARSSFQTLKENVKVKLTLPYASISIDDNDDDDLEIMELYRKNGKTSVKLTINIDKTFKARVLVHRKDVSVNHHLWIGLPPRFNSFYKISNLLSRLRQFAVCLGNPDEEFQSLVPFDQSDKGSSERFAYKEGDFCAEMGEMSYSSTIRSVDCELLVEGRRCSRCATYRRSLWAQKHRLEDKTKLMDKNLLKSNYKHKDMTKEMLIEKIRQQKMCIDLLQQELNQSRREIKKGMRS